MGEEEAAAGVAVVVVPLPAQGHLNQLLHFARLVSARGVVVHYVASATHVRQATERVHGWDPASGSGSGGVVHFHRLPLPSFPSPPPDPHAPTKFPRHLQPAFDAALHLRAPLAALLRSISATARRVAVVHDSLMSFAADVATSLPNAESYSFHSCSAFASLFYQWESRGKPPEPWVRQLGIPDLPLDSCFTAEFVDFIRRQHRMTSTVAGRLFNSCHAIEGEFLGLQAGDPGWRGQRLFAVGPLNPVAVEGSRKHQCLRWLDGQPRASVLYVSFGTTSSLTKWQASELAAGLERSKQRFLWVLRDADRGDIYAGGDSGRERALEAVLPRDYDRRVEGRGLVVRDGWAPQLEILAHGSTGGFMSHCGWNSCMESVSMAVPMLAWPMHSDQPRNALLVTRVLRIGIAVREWGGGTAEEVPMEAVRDAVERLMVGEEGREVRRRAEAVGVAVRAAVGEGGTSRGDLDSFVANVTR